MGQSNLNINNLRKAFAKNENITKILSERSDMHREEVIEIAYDIQSGTYTDAALANLGRLEQYAREIYEFCEGIIIEDDTILDCGAGELTTTSALSKHFPSNIQLLACDISLSRLRVGRRFADRFMRDDIANELNLFVSDMADMPLADNSVDVIITTHALEPNHGREANLLRELLRITRRNLILFEPSWENATNSMRARMEEHGYIRELPHHIKEAGGELISVKPLPHPMNQMNPTYCYVVKVGEESSGRHMKKNQTFQCPRSGFPLKKQANYWWSKEGGWAYPQIEGISCLRAKHGVLMSHD
ncbi:class I SAM-dependent methyltransferase [bacterium]|nr:class I SAM-dependent methyltransferase [bacterium]